MYTAAARDAAGNNEQHDDEKKPNYWLILGIQVVHVVVERLVRLYLIFPAHEGHGTQSHDRLRRSDTSLADEAHEGVLILREF